MSCSARMITFQLHFEYNKRKELSDIDANIVPRLQSRIVRNDAALNQGTCTRRELTRVRGIYLSSKFETVLKAKQQRYLIDLK